MYVLILLIILNVFRVVLVAFKNQTEMFNGNNCASILSNMTCAENFDYHYSRVFHLISHNDKIDEKDLKKYAIVIIIHTYNYYVQSCVIFTYFLFCFDRPASCLQFT